MKNAFKGLTLAFAMLTTLPTFKIHTFDKGINGYAVAFYPLVGLLLGVLLWGIHTMIEPYFTKEHGGVIIFALLVVLTGALHLDGLADTVDGLFVSKERAFEVMKEPHIGAMGMIFGAVFLITKASAFSSLDSYAILPLILLLSRANASFTIYLYPYRGGGIASLAKAEFTTPLFLFAFIFALVAVALYGKWLLFIGTLLVLFATAAIFTKRYGGLSGDIYGFCIEISELLALNAALLP